jgi:hypothetical protein
MKLNPIALEKAKTLLDEGKFRISTPWKQVQPSAQAQSAYLEQHGLVAYQQWYLAINPDAPEGSPERYQLPFGDFNSLHRSGLVAARQRAEQSQSEDIQTAVDDLLFVFDRLTAC